MNRRDRIISIAILDEIREREEKKALSFAERIRKMSDEELEVELEKHVKQLGYEKVVKPDESN